MWRFGHAPKLKKENWTQENGVQVRGYYMLSLAYIIATRSL